MELGAIVLAMANFTWEKQWNTQGIYPLAEIKKEVAGNSYMPRKYEHYEKEKLCGYPKETFDTCCTIKNLVSLHFY